MRLISELGMRLLRHRLGNRLLRTRLGVACASRVGRLARRLPLSTPTVVHVDPVNLCNFKCSFCPQGDEALLRSVGRPKGMMDLGLFKKVIGDLGEFGEKVVLLCLYKDGESLLHKNIVEMVRHARQAEVAEIVEIVTNGSLLDERMAGELIGAGLDSITISVEHVTDEGYKALTRTFSDYEKIRRQVAFLFDEKVRRGSALKVKVKVLGNLLSAEERSRFGRDFANISDTIECHGLMGWSLSGLKDFTLGREVATGIDGFSPIKATRSVCSLPFTSLAVNFNGSVSACCNDWALGLIVGDVGRSRLLDIWNGDELRKLRLAHLEGRRSAFPVCADSQYMLGLPPWSDLDADAADLARRISW